MKRIDYYKTYYENLSPSNFKVEKEDDKIVISGIGTHYLKGFNDKDVKQYKVKQSKIDKYEKGGKVKQQQLEIIKKTNPAPNEYNLWVRTENDIKSAKEVFSETFKEDDSMYPDFTQDDMREVLKSGSVRVYSSYPIKEGVFVTPSKRNAQDYAGGQNSFVYSKKVSINDIAWLDESEGQYAPIVNVKFGKRRKKSFQNGGRTKGFIKKPITTNYQQIRNWIDEYFIDKEHLGEIHHSNKSSTDFGTSWYTIVDINGAFFVEPITIRISDHSTGNRRILNEIQISSSTNNKKEIFKRLDLTFDKYFEKGGGIGQYAPLYHYVKRDMIIPILWDDKLKGSFVKGDKEYGVSTTRNPYSQMKRHNHNDDRLVLDQNKLRRDGYKIVPFDYLSIAIGREDETNINHYATKIDPSRDTMKGFGFEYEEVILGNIEPLEDYLLYIDISFDKEDKSDFKIKKIKKDLHLWENIMDEYPNAKLRLYQWGKRPYVVSIEDLRKLVKQYEDKNPPIKIKRKKRMLQNGGQVPMNVKFGNSKGEEDSRVLFSSEYFRLMKDGVIENYDTLQEALDEVPKSYKRIDDDEFNILMRNAENRNALQFTPIQVMVSHLKNTEYDYGDDTEVIDEYVMVSKRTYKMLDFSKTYSNGGGVKHKKTDANFEEALQKWESSMTNNK